MLTKVTVRIPDSLYRRLLMRCVEQRSSVQVMFETMIEDALAPPRKQTEAAAPPTPRLQHEAHASLRASSSECGEDWPLIG